MTIVMIIAAQYAGNRRLVREMTKSSGTNVRSRVMKITNPLITKNKLTPRYPHGTEGHAICEVVQLVVLERGERP